LKITNDYPCKSSDPIDVFGKWQKGSKPLPQLNEMFIRNAFIVYLGIVRDIITEMQVSFQNLTVVKRV
jgi:hypothetical protein